MKIKPIGLVDVMGVMSEKKKKLFTNLLLHYLKSVVQRPPTPQSPKKHVAIDSKFLPDNF